MSKIVGHISQVIGPVVDVHFDLEGLDAEVALPKIHDAMTVVRKDGRTLVIEVQRSYGQYRRTKTRNGSCTYRTAYNHAGGSTDQRTCDERSGRDNRRNVRTGQEGRFPYTPRASTF